jgi:hypothetical protein
MTEVVPLKAGEILVPKKGTNWDLSRYKQIKLVAVSNVGDIEQWWCEVVSNYNTTMATFSTHALRKGWERKPSFFQVGKVYGFLRYDAGETFKVMDIYQMENPYPGSEGRVAMSIATDRDGRNYGMTLSSNDFKKMREVG